MPNSGLLLYIYLFFKNLQPKPSLILSKMMIKIFIVLGLYLTVSAQKESVNAVPDLSGYYHMDIPHDDSQYIFNIGWSKALNQYLVVSTGQPLGWGIGRINFINDTAMNVAFDNDYTLLGIITYEKGLPIICWPAFEEYQCWNGLLSNITRIHVINM